MQEESNQEINSVTRKLQTLSHKNRINPIQKLKKNNLKTEDYKQKRIQRRRQNMELYQNSFTTTGYPQLHLDTCAKTGAPTCVVCLNNEPCCVLVPCGHKKMCATCAEMYTFNSGSKKAKCPICRCDIAVFVVVFE